MLRFITLIVLNITKYTIPDYGIQVKARTSTCLVTWTDSQLYKRCCRCALDFPRCLKTSSKQILRYDYWSIRPTDTIDKGVKDIPWDAVLMGSVVCTVEPLAGYDPTTPKLQILCSTDWATEANSGRSRIQTYGTRESSPHFKYGAIDHSAILPFTIIHMVCFSCPTRSRTSTLSDQNRTCCQLHHRTKFPFN